MAHTSRPYTLDRVVRLTITLICIGAAIWLLNTIKGALLPFVLAWLFAYMLEPIVLWNKRITHLKSRFVPVMMTLLEIIIIFTILGWIFIPRIVEQVEEMGVLFKVYAESSNNIPFVPDVFEDFVKRYINFSYIASIISGEQIMNIVETVLSSTWQIISSSAAALIEVFSWCVCILYLLFIMIDYDKIQEIFKNLIPHKAKGISIKITNDVTHGMNRYFRGQSLIALCVGILFSIGFSIVGIPLAIPLGMFIGALNMVPYLQLIGFIPTILLCMAYSTRPEIHFWPTFWYCLIVFAVVQIIQDMILTPKIMGKAMGLNPAFILLSLSIWGTLLGFFGLVIALPLTTILISYYKEYILGDKNSSFSHSNQKAENETTTEEQQIKE